MKASDRAIALIKEFEGFAPEVYDDVGGKGTIGYGHLIKRGEAFGKLTEQEATALLCRDLEDAEACLADAVDVPLSQPQYDALCSFVFNLGCAAFRGSTLLKLLNVGNYDRAALEFDRWSRVGMNQVGGLLRRRIAERLLFCSK